MKLKLTTLLLFTALATFAQDTAWTKGKAAVFGTQKEKHDQDALFQRDGYEIYRLIGYKEYYANGISSYLQTHGYSLHDTRKVAGVGTEFVFDQQISMGHDPQIYFKYWVNADKRITKVRITGYPYGLASLFVNYWPTDIQWTSTAQLRHGVIAKKMLIDERITFNYGGVEPFIEVTK